MSSEDLATSSAVVTPAIDDTASNGVVASKSTHQSLRSTSTTRSRSGSSASVLNAPNGAVRGLSITSGTGLSVETIQRSGRGRSSRAAAAALLASDGRYKRYAQAIERCLSTFDAVAEWADFIAFLSRLLKTIQSAQPPFTEIPYKLIIAKRLAQGLNPALPNGVHQKSLEVYREILRALGIDGLKRDLQVWSPGLFPFFQFAATGLKPSVLDLYESFYIPLGRDLRPVAKSMALALLPGIEEETGDYFDRNLGLLIKLADSVDTGFFYQCLFLIMVTNASSRLAAANYLSRRLKPRISELSAEEGTAALVEIIGSDTGLLVRGLAASLDDDNVLVRRGVLDLLIAILPLNRMSASNINETDRRQLMLAACSIVLRRDLSLNKRLYIWLLSSSDEAEIRTAYFLSNGLFTLTEALASDMRDATTSPGQTRDVNMPFKVYIALLDNWEIGFPLSQALTMRALETLRAGIITLSESSDATIRAQGSDLQVTAHTLYDASEPSVISSNFFQFIRDDFGPDTPGKEDVLHMDLIIWVLNSFRIHDDEVLLVHAPLLLGRVMQFVHDRATSDKVIGPGDSRLLESALEVASLLANIVPKAAFKDHPNEEDTDFQANDLRAADEFYQPSERSAANFCLGGHSYFSLLFKCVIASFRPLRAAEDAIVLRLASICQRLVEIQCGNGHDQLLSWESAEWINLIAEIAHQSTSFDVVQALVSTVAALRDCPNISPSIDINSPTTLRPFILSAYNMLESHTLEVQPEIVALIWKLHDLSPFHIVETIVSERLGTGDLASRTRSMSAFGTLWRLTDESHNPGTVLYRPALMVLGFLRHDQLVLKRAAETWMRCYLRSAFRILDPLLFDLLSDDLRTKPYSRKLADHQITVPRYIGRADFDRCKAFLEVTLNLIEIGGQAMQRACRSTALSETMDKQLLSRVVADVDLNPDSSYTDLLVGLCTRLVSTQPSVLDTPRSKEANAGVQAAALQILQVLVGRGDIPLARLRKVESSLVDQLFVCIHTVALDIQNQLLHLLHTVILAIAAGEAAQREPTSPSALEGNRIGEDKASWKSRTSISEFNNPLLLRMLQDGLIVKSNRCLLQFWVDFILMTVPHLVGSLQPLCFPLCDTICKEIDSVAMSWQNKVHWSVTDTEAEVVMLLSCLERVALTAMSWSNLDSARNGTHRGLAETAGLFGYVSNVFQPETPASSHSPMRVPGMRCLRTTVATLVLVWQTGSGSANGLLARCSNRCRKMFERLYQTHEDEVMTAVVECTVGDDGVVLFPSAWELLEFLLLGAQQIVKRLCDSLTASLNAPLKNGDTMTWDQQAKTLHFLLGYFETLEGPIVVQSWTSCVNLAKATHANASNVAPDMLLLYLRFFTKFGLLVSTTAALSDKRMRKDWQDSYSKLLDVVLVTAGRAAFVPSRPPTPKIATNSGTNDMGPMRRTSKENLKARGNVEDVLERLCHLLAGDVVPHLRDLLLDTERVQTACAAIAQNVLQPAFKGRARFGDIDVLALDILLAMSHLTTVQKHWRTYVSEALADGTVFQASQATRSQWKQLVAVMMDQERDRLLDLLNRVAAPPSANIFANRELEMQQRCLNLRRLSLVVFAASHNHFIVQLPAIQERLVDLLRTNNVSSAVHIEVYLCIRVLLCRFSPQHLVNLWPIILSELIKTFDQAMDNIPEQGTETLYLLLSACKLLDLLLVMQTEDFQIHQWLFVTDTPDAQDPPDGWIAEAIMDRLAELVSDHYHADSSAPILRYPVAQEGSRPRRPMLTHVKNIGSLLELEPFFSQASISAYAGMYNGNSVDWEYVEGAMEREIFERS